MTVVVVTATAESAISTSGALRRTVESGIVVMVGLVSAVGMALL